MKRPSFLEGVAVALAASLLGSLVYTVLAPLFGSAVILRLLIAGAGFGYLIYLLRRSPERVGRITLICLWGLAATAAWILNLPLLHYLALHLGLIWLARSLYFYSSLLSALADLGLTAFSLAAALWAMNHSHSLFLGIWSLFLVQALFTFIPASLQRRDKALPETDRFDRAHRAAETALRKLSSVQ
jgi:hypothetical protein